MQLTKKQVIGDKSRHILKGVNATFYGDHKTGLTIRAMSPRRTHVYTLWLTPFEVEELKLHLNREPVSVTEETDNTPEWLK